MREKKKGMVIAEKGKSVKIHYTGTLDDGTVFDTSKDKAPLEFVIGGGQVIVGFEEAVLGMSVGETKAVAIPPEKAYGERQEEMVITAPRDQVPPDLDVEVGQMLQMGAPSGELVQVVVVDVTEKEVTLDANPPLAGKKLNFDIELVEIA